MCVGVVFTGLMMFVAAAVWRERLDPLRNIPQKSRFRVIDINARCDVHRTHEAKTILHAGTLQHTADQVSDIDEGIALRQFNVEILSVMNVRRAIEMLNEFVSVVPGTGMWIQQPVA